MMLGYCLILLINLLLLNVCQLTDRCHIIHLRNRSRERKKRRSWCTTFCFGVRWTTSHAEVGAVCLVMAGV